ncbi:MAG: Ig-like domain-containing protein, partial [Anaerolineae bacterium]|nr:Ig-like domain-containing protein [Anaerolineae bacterium]
MRIRLLWTGLFILTLVGVATGANPWQQSAIPRVMETLPFAGEELQLDQTITLYFNQAMDRESVENALSIVPDTASTLTWEDDTTLTISPSESWPRDALLEVTISTEAATTDGTPLEEPYKLTYQTVGYLQVVEVLPTAGENNVSTNGVVTVIFNRPVVPLVAIEEQDTLVDPLEIVPEIEGKGEWLNTSIYTFTPSDGWAGGIEYTVTINAGLTDSAGAILQEDYVWMFSTAPPEVSSIFPYDDSSKVRLDTAVTIEFTQSMNPAVMDDAISLNDADGNPVLVSLRWTDSNRKVTLTPMEPFSLDTAYQVVVDADISASMSGAKLRRSETANFVTVPYPAIITTSPADGEKGAYPYGGFSIYFNTDIDEDTLEDKVIIEPEPWREFESYYYDYDYRYTLFFDTEPSTDYTVTILPGIKDIYGNEITEGLTVSYRTAPYDPEINLNVPGFVGLYSAYNETTRVFSTHRNIDQLNLELYNVELSTLLRLTGENVWEFRDTWSPSERELIRRWSMNVQSQPNVRRYELLLLSEEGSDGIQNLQCLGAPAITMMTGDLARVTETDPRPLRIRSLPNLQGDIVELLDPGTTFKITEGPICADGYIWWQIETEGETPVTGWAAEGTTESYFMEVVERGMPTPDPADYPPLPTGVYYLTLTSPDLFNQYEIEHVMVVSTVNITLKFSPNQVMAWVTDLQTGEPVVNQEVSFYDDDRREIGRLTTDENGIALLEIPHLDTLYTTLYAVVDEGEQFGFVHSELSDGLDPWNFNIYGDFYPEDLSIYLYTDRPIYRPDQPVYFKGVVRHRDDVTFTLPNEIEVPVKIYDPQGQVVYETVLPISEQGSFAGEFMLDQEAGLGYYRISAELASNQRSEFSLGFSVAEYVAPEFQVEATAAKDEVVQGETIQMNVESSYFFGGAVSNAVVEWSVLSRNYFFNYMGKDRYDFTDYNYDAGPVETYGEYGEQIATGFGRTDSEGRFVIEVPADLGTRTQSQEYTIEARVVDESDQLVAGRAQVVVHQGEVYVGVRAARYISTAGQPATVNMVVVDWESEPVANQEVDYKIVERRWSSVQEEDELGRTVWTWEVEELPLEDGEGTVTTDAEGKATMTFTPPLAGTYKIYAETRDSKGNKILSSTYMWVTGRNYVSWRQQNSNRFDLITDADNYKVGDTAEILIASPFQGESLALVTIERGSIIHHEVIRMETNSHVYNLPITPEFAPNVFVSVVLVKGVDENTPYSEFRMGMAQLQVDTEQLVLNIEVTPNVDITKGEFVGPGDEVTYTVKTTDWEGNPVSAEVGLSVTDLAVLTIAPDNSPTPMEHFYSQRGVSVRTGTTLTISVDKVTQTIIDTVKGGGGGGGEAGIFDIREEFVDTPGWQPDVITDENGLATYTLTLPDNLTTWRLVARGMTTGEDGPMLVGNSTSDVLSTKPLLIRPLTPRFMIVNDMVEFAAVVNNNTGETQTAEVTLEGTGFELLEGVSLTQTVEIPSQGRARINWQAKVMDVPAIDLTFYVSGNEGAFTDASKPPLGQGENNLLPVYKYEVAEIVGTGGAMTEEGSRSEAISLPRAYDVTQGELTVRIDRSLAAATVDGLDYLQNYPYQ